MKIGITGLIIAVALLVVLVLTLVGSCVSAYNSEITLRTQVEAKVKEQGIVFDNTWKIIQQQAQVSQKYLDSFKEIYPLLMGERYKEGEAQLAKLVTEANPTIDTRLQEKLMNSIEAQRTTFTRTQKELIDINREHTQLIRRFPGSLFFSLIGRREIPISLITSQKTEDTMKSGQDNDVNLY